MDDSLIIGGGVIGLSLAWELAQAGQRVRVIDRGAPGKAASWAGAGIFPPGKFLPQASPISRLVGLSNELLPHWSARLLELTGIDNGFRRTGSLALAGGDPAEVADLQITAANLRAVAAQIDDISLAQVAELEPNIDLSGAGIRAAIALPEETQLRNPRHLKALLSACQQLGVQIEADVAATHLQVTADRIVAVETDAGTRRADQICLASGAWSQTIAQTLGVTIPIKPIRGQMLLLHSERPILNRIVNVGRRYVVPRDDGRILVGSTLEDVGFAPLPTAGGVAGLLQFGLQLIPQLAQATLEQSWAGLRPGTTDGLPYLGRLPGLANGFIAAGHYRAGLHLSPITAILIRRLMLGDDPQFDLSPFRVGRAAASCEP